MPVRRIGLCYRSVSGRVPMGPGRGTLVVESTLERDFALLQRFDPDVTRVEAQPVRIEYRSSGGSIRRYVPDFFVQYGSRRRKSRLVEVKLSTDPALLAGDLDERFSAAEAYAANHGWTFAVVTEVDIRTPRLTNVTFLLPYTTREPDAAVRSHFLGALRARSGPIEVLADEAAGALGCDRAEVLPTLWSMIARREIEVDLDTPLVMRSVLHSVAGEGP